MPSLGENNLISWKTSDEDGIQKIVLEYSTNSTDWKTITEITDANEFSQGEYAWNVSAIEDSTYFVRVSVIDSKNVTTSKSSESFAIQNKDNEQPGEEE